MPTWTFSLTRYRNFQKPYNLKFSIITVTYNSASTLEATILSVLNQTYPDTEYIIVDGQSTDQTLQVISKYQAKISRVVSEKDKGLYDAINKGIDMATGDVIGILDIIESTVKGIYAFFKFGFRSSDKSFAIERIYQRTARSVP